MANKATPAAKPVVVVNLNEPGERRSFGEWITCKIGDTVETAFDGAGEIAGAFDAGSESFAMTREISSKSRISRVKERALRRAKRAGVELSFE